MKTLKIRNEDDLPEWKKEDGAILSFTLRKAQTNLVKCFCRYLKRFCVHPKCLSFPKY